MEPLKSDSPNLTKYATDLAQNIINDCDLKAQNDVLIIIYSKIKEHRKDIMENHEDAAVALDNAISNLDLRLGIGKE